MKLDILKNIDEVFKKHAWEIEKTVSQDTLEWTKNLKKLVSADGEDDGIVLSMPLYGWILDQGSKAHIIRPKEKEFLAFEIDGDWIFTKMVKHPGTRPQPWINESLDMDQLAESLLNKMSYNYIRWIEVEFNNGEFIAGRTPWNK